MLPCCIYATLQFFAGNSREDQAKQIHFLVAPLVATGRVLACSASIPSGSVPRFNVAPSRRHGYLPEGHCRRTPAESRDRRCPNLRWFLEERNQASAIRRGSAKMLRPQLVLHPVWASAPELR